jgi:hypothetical protein
VRACQHVSMSAFAGATATIKNIDPDAIVDRVPAASSWQRGYRLPVQPL